MQFPRSSSELPSDDVAHTTTRARFPNAVQFAPIFAGRQAPNASPPLDAPFFAEFESSFVEAARRLTAPTAEVLFDGSGSRLSTTSREVSGVRTTSFPKRSFSATIAARVPYLSRRRRPFGSSSTRRSVSTSRPFAQTRRFGTILTPTRKRR